MAWSERKKNPFASEGVNPVPRPPVVRALDEILLSSNTFLLSTWFAMYQRNHVVTDY